MDFSDNRIPNTDFSIICADKEVRFSKFMISSRSNYFAALFKGPWKETQTSKVSAIEKSFDVVNRILNMIYVSNQTNFNMFCQNYLTDANVYEIAHTANEWGLDSVLINLENYLVDSFEDMNMIILTNLSIEITQFSRLKRKISKYFKRNPDAFERINQNPSIGQLLPEGFDIIFIDDSQTDDFLDTLDLWLEKQTKDQNDIFSLPWLDEASHVFYGQKQYLRLISIIIKRFREFTPEFKGKLAKMLSMAKNMHS